MREWVYSRYAESFAEITVLPVSERARLDAAFDISGLAILDVQESAKTPTRKFLLQASDRKRFEAVLIPDVENDRDTLCLSSQVGCSFACSFCATGTMGFRRNLTAAEIAGQYSLLQKRSGGRIRNIVYMGMGEPFANQAEVFDSIRILTDPERFAMSPSRISVSTSGVLSGIRRLTEELPKVWLLISLHSAIQEKRDRIMPNVKGQPLVELKEALLAWQAVTGTTLTFEYIMLRGFNDGGEDAEALLEFGSGLDFKVNLIAYNRNPGLGLDPSFPETIAAFKEGLEAEGVTVVQRFKKGDDIAAACGQLAVKDPE